MGYNARVPIHDLTLPRGGGPDGKSPVVVLKGTQIRELHAAHSASSKLTQQLLVYGLLSLQHRNDIGVDHVNEWRPERWGK